MRHQALLFLVLATVCLSVPIPAAGEWYDDCFLSADQNGYRRLDPESDCAESPFTNIFELYVQDGLFNPATPGHWTEADLSTFMTTIIDADSTTNLDVFPQMWKYLCTADTDGRWDHISMEKIPLRLHAYPSTQWPTPSVYYILDTRADPDTFLAAEGLARGLFPHEFGHTIVGLNTDNTTSWANEMWAEGGEYFGGLGQGENAHAPFFDISFESYIGPLPGSAYAPYQNYDFLWAYLWANFKGPTDQDDVMYRWVRSSTPTGSYTSFSGLAVVLGSDPTYNYLGTSGSERAGGLFHRMGMAMYINRPDTLNGIYGLGDYSTEKAHLFDWIDHDGMRARVVPPEFIVGEAQEQPTVVDSVDDVLDIEKTDACRTKPLGIRRWGMDYLVFKADPEYFATHGDTLLRIELKGTQTAPDSTRLRAAYVAYKSIADTLWKSPIHAIVDTADAEIYEGTARVGITVEEFGQTVKAVVVMLSLVDDPVEENSRGQDRAVTCWTDIESSAPDIPYDLTYQLTSSQLDVPAKYQEIQDAIDFADPGQIVRVGWQAPPYHAFAMKRGVRVERAIGFPPPIVVSDSTFVVDFPADSDTLTTLSDFDIQGGTDAIIRLRGAGRIEGCTLRADDSRPAAGVLISGGSGLIRDSQVLMEEPLYAARGIEAHNATLLIDQCEIRARNEHPQSTGVWADSSAGTIQWSRVTATGQGLHIDGEAEIVNCMVDSTGSEGIDATGGVTVENCVVEHVLNAGYNGIVAPTVRYCIAPDGISAQTAVANSLDDPVYCDPVAHTLRADSYASPENNPSGRVIGIGTVTCIGDTLTHDTTISRSDLDVVSDIVVPAGTRFTLLPGSGLQFPEGTGLEVNGSLTVTGASSQRILLEGIGWQQRWEGITVGPHAKVQIENAELRFPTVGIADYGATAADTISLRNVKVYPDSAGIKLTPLQADTTAVLLLDHVDIFPQIGPGGMGIYVDRAASSYSYDVDCEVVYISGTNEKRYGIYLDTSGTMVGGHPPRLRNIRLLDAGAGAALTLINSSATIDSLEVEGWASGVEVVGSGSPSIRNFWISGVATGIRTEGTTTALFEDGEILASTLGLESLSEGTAAGGDTLRSVYINGCVEHGVYAEGPAHIIGCTVDSTYGEGIACYEDAVVENTIVTNVLYDFPPYVLHPGIFGGSAYYCIAPNGISVPAGHGAGNSTDDPLYCDPAERTLRVDSYGNPNNNDSGKLIGKFPVACMGDTLVRNSTYYGGALDMRGHVTIPADRTLTLWSGTTVTVDTTSVPGSGKPEIRVMGTLKVNGSQSQRAQIRSSSKEPGSWGGIRTQYSDAHIVLNYVDMYDFETGFTDIGGQIDSLYVAHGQFGNFTNAAIFLDEWGYGGLVRLLNTSVHMEGAPYGIWIDSWAESYGVDFDSVTVTGDADGEYGVILNTEAPASDPSFELNLLGISGLTTGTGFSGGMVCPTIYGGEITGCKTGVSAFYTGSVSLSGGGSSPFEITGCTTGLYLAGSATATVDDIVIGDIPSGGIGLYTDYSSEGSFTDVSIAGGATGFKSYSTGEQTFRSGGITGFTNYGVLVAVASPVDLGVAGQNEGNNSIYSSSSNAKYVYAKNHLSELGPVMAQSNWWGAYPAPSTRFTTLTVEYQPERQTVPPQSARVTMVELPAVLGLMATPNPSRDRLLIRADFPTPQASAVVEVFDVTGRRVRTLLDGELPAGRREIAWDGADQHGATVATGIYFIRLRAGKETRTTRILRIR